jgi:hypothetical protein
MVALPVCCPLTYSPVRRTAIVQQNLCRCETASYYISLLTCMTCNASPASLLPAPPIVTPASLPQVCTGRNYADEIIAWLRYCVSASSPPFHPLTATPLPLIDLPSSLICTQQVTVCAGKKRRHGTILERHTCISLLYAEVTSRQYKSRMYYMCSHRSCCRHANMCRCHSCCCCRCCASVAAVAGAGERMC